MNNMQTVRQAAEKPEFRQELTDLLVRLCRIDTTPHADVGESARAEREAFQVIRGYLAELGLSGLRTEDQPINPAIAKHPFFSQLYYTRSAEQPQGLSVEQAYRGRGNLLAMLGGDGGAGGGAKLALNAHIDVVRPYIPPKVEADAVFGRGSCDDKGPLVSILGALRLVAGYLKQSGKRLNRDLICMFVIEEETGGNGSLSLALDRQLRGRYDTIMVMECCSSKIHPGNRGAVWYKVEARLPGVNLFEALAFIIEEMEREGRSIRAESAHELFPHRPVQTCHGMIGAFGEHPSRICGRVDFRIGLTGDAGRGQSLIRDVIDDAIAQYVGLYGDKTKVIDQQTGKPKVDHHYDLIADTGGFIVQVHGSTGHMGSILLNDGAITKMATMVRSLLVSRAAIERAAGGKMQLELSNWPDASHLLMEGGQGFLPTHSIDEVQDRLRRAVWRGAERYLGLIGRREEVQAKLNVSYDKLHNAAFAGDSNSPAMQDAIAAAKTAGIWQEGPIRGWDVSCDSRIFACEYSDLLVLTSGPGHLIHAHADNEQVHIGEVVKFAEFLACFLLKHTGTIGA